MEWLQNEGENIDYYSGFREEVGLCPKYNGVMLSIHPEPFRYEKQNIGSISDFPDHATFREMGVNTGLVGQAWGVSSL